MCPETLDILSRAVLVGVGLGGEREALDKRIELIKKALLNIAK
jgi:hypothetical protein